MARIRYIKGDATKPIGDGVKIIAHVCNDEGGWGAGFTQALSMLSRVPEDAYREWFTMAGKTEEYKFSGVTQVVEVGSNLLVANMVAQHGYKSKDNPVPLCYDCLYSCLFDLAGYAIADEATIHMPRIGCGLGGGDWVEVEELIHDALNGIDVYVYDLE